MSMLTKRGKHVVVVAEKGTGGTWDRMYWRGMVIHRFNELFIFLMHHGVLEAVLFLRESGVKNIIIPRGEGELKETKRFEGVTTIIPHCRRRYTDAQ